MSISSAVLNQWGEKWVDLFKKFVKYEKNGMGLINAVYSPLIFLLRNRELLNALLACQMCVQTYTQ
jgi:hypothetical protein